VLVEVKTHRYEVVGANRNQRLSYLTFTVGPGLFYEIHLWRGLFLQPLVRWWPRAGATTPQKLQPRLTIVATLPSGTPTLPQVARSLGLSERTLRRRLAGQRTSFQDLLEGCRSSLAGRYLERRDLALAEIAFLLGFSEPSPFYRAFRRWYGLSPERYRQGLSMQ
jgi:AraC-like DNA-binding protein